MIVRKNIVISTGASRRVGKQADCQNLVQCTLNEYNEFDTFNIWAKK
ncbi:MAG: hypothetical protein HN392_07180 [Anaerolineae bacterium]|nr:hypothetical protein [Anaerolineae bacterium]MBT7782368.1 hypothetical protein [Anaerolineae bacterium]